MRPIILLCAAAFILQGCAFASWENGGTSIRYDGGGLHPDGGWLIHRSSATEVLPLSIKEQPHDA